MAKYQTTKLATIEALNSGAFKIGQWVSLDGGIIRGQYLGKTRTGAVVVRWQQGTFGKIADTKSNHYLRQFAIVNGSK